MKKVILSLLFISTALVSCDDNTSADVSRVTNYPEFTLLGDEVVYVQKGSAYTDAGVIVTEGGVEIPHEITITGKYRGESSVNTDIVDIYTIIYSAVNQDGFAGSIARTVVVYEDSDLVTGISGLYTSTVVRNGAANPQYYDMEYVLVWKNSNGTYTMSDGIGGYYDLGRAYGAGYAAGPVTITAIDIATNTYAPIPSFGVGDFGGTAVMTGLTANPGAGTLSFSTEWDSGYTFVVTMTKVVL